MTVPHVHSPNKKLAVPTDGLVRYSRNPGRGNVSAIMGNPKHHGQYKPMVVRAGTNEGLAGNHTWTIMQDMGWDQIAAAYSGGRPRCMLDLHHK